MFAFSLFGGRRSVRNAYNIQQPHTERDITTCTAFPNSTVENYYYPPRIIFCLFVAIMDTTFVIVESVLLVVERYVLMGSKKKRLLP